MGIDERALHAEAEFLFRRIFDLSATAELTARYAQAHVLLEMEDSAATKHLLALVLRHDLDLESLEYVLRLRNPRNQLTRKIHILYYLAECDPRTLPVFYGSARTGVSKLSILMIPLRCGYAWLKGSYQLRRYRLA